MFRVPKHKSEGQKYALRHDQKEESTSGVLEQYRDEMYRLRALKITGDTYVMRVFWRIMSSLLLSRGISTSCVLLRIFPKFVAQYLA